jgi:hypothetical protein
MHWSMCTPVAMGVCTPIPSKNGTADPGPQPAGTVFKLTAIYQGRTYARSLAWSGAIAVAALPTLSGRARYGAVVTGGAALWTGGWGTEVDQPRHRGLPECPRNQLCDAQRRGASMFARGLRVARWGDWPAQAAESGSYRELVHRLVPVRARRAPRRQHLRPRGVRLPAAIPPWPTNATVIRSAPYGPVTGPAPPRVRFLPDAQVHGNEVTVASVRCAVSCHAWITVSLTGKRVASGGRVAWSANKVVTGSEMIGVRGPVPPGRVTVSINVGDGAYLHGHSLLR